MQTSYTEAKRLGLKRYFPGTPCKNGHVSERYTASGECWQCRQEWRKANRAETNVKQHYLRFVSRMKLPKKTKKFKQLETIEFRERFLENKRQKYISLIKNLPLSKKEAIASGKRFYFSGKLCKNDHPLYRETRAGGCRICRIRRTRKKGRSFGVIEHNRVHTEVVTHYNLYKDRLLPEDGPKKGTLGMLLVKCYKCGLHFAPNHKAVAQRVLAIKGKKDGYYNLYCSDKCKNTCSAYRFKSNSIDPRSELYVKKTDQGKARACKTDHLKQIQCDEYGYNYCEKCGDIIDVELHHTHPVATNGTNSISSAGHILLCAGCHVGEHALC